MEESPDHERRERDDDPDPPPCSQYAECDQQRCQARKPRPKAPVGGPTRGVRRSRRERVSSCETFSAYRGVLGFGLGRDVADVLERLPAGSRRRIANA